MNQINGFNPIDAMAKPKTSQFSELSSEEFMRIIFTELTNQDPLQPNDSASLLQQLSTIRSIESDLKLMKQLEALVHDNQLASAGNLIGKFIGGYSEDFHGVAGWVVAVLKQGNAIHLELDSGWIVPLANVQTVIDPSLLPPDEQPDPPPGGADPVDDEPKNDETDPEKEPEQDEE